MITASNPFTDLAKLFAKFKFADVDIASVITAQHSDIDALAAASKQARDGMQNLVNKQMKFLITTMREIQATVERIDDDGKSTGSLALPCEFVALTLQRRS